MKKVLLTGIFSGGRQFFGQDHLFKEKEENPRHIWNFKAAMKVHSGTLKLLQRENAPPNPSVITECCQPRLGEGSQTNERFTQVSLMRSETFQSTSTEGHFGGTQKEGWREPEAIWPVAGSALVGALLQPHKPVQLVPDPFPALSEIKAKRKPCPAS